MKKLLGAAVVLACGIAGTALAQTSHTESTTKHTDRDRIPKTKTETVVGIVKEYEAERASRSQVPTRRIEFDLDENARVSGNIVVGKMARVEYRKDDSGREHVVVISDSTKATKMDHSTGRMPRPPSWRGDRRRADAHGEPRRNTPAPARHEDEVESRHRNGQGLRGRKKITVTGPTARTTRSISMRASS